MSVVGRARDIALRCPLCGMRVVDAGRSSAALWYCPVHEQCEPRLIPAAAIKRYSRDVEIEAKQWDGLQMP